VRDLAIDEPGAQGFVKIVTRLPTLFPVASEPLGDDTPELGLVDAEIDKRLDVGRQDRVNHRLIARSRRKIRIQLERGWILSEREWK
jgi:hypothetical protein